MSNGIAARLSRDRTVNTYGVMWHASKVLYKLGKEDKRGATWKYMGSILLAAFSLEAFLNQIGSELYSCWDDIERKLSPKAKLRLLGELLEIKLDFSKRPYQTIIELFKFRNDVAHGRPEKLAKVEEVLIPHEEMDDLIAEQLEPWWTEYCIQENVEKIREDVKTIINEYHDASGIDDIVFSLGMQSGSLELLNSDE